jgi:hypothetical protein
MKYFCDNYLPAFIALVVGMVMMSLRVIGLFLLPINSEYSDHKLHKAHKFIASLW